MLKRTPLFEQHLREGALMVNFAGWEMPLHYGSQIDEHRKVRQDAGMFDVSHMGVIDIEGEAAAALLRLVLANNIDKLKTSGRALYSCMLNEAGGVIDDLIVYYLSPSHYRLIVNASTTEKDLAWLKKCAGDYSVAINHQTGLAMLAIQGPTAKEKVARVLPWLAPGLQFKSNRPSKIRNQGRYRLVHVLAI